MDKDSVKLTFAEVLMAEALSLAEKGRGKVLPNPMVGALVVKEGQVLGRGWHDYYGAEHAEAVAIQEAKKSGDCQKGTLFCTLEPCCFRSPEKHNSPCTEEIIKSGLKKVYVARLDPNPRVRGQGVKLLRKAGLQVETGMLTTEAAELNRVYETLVLRKRPYVHLKVALTMDGYMAAFDGHSSWISCEESRRRVMELRAECAAVLVGAGTVRADRPRLSVRGDGAIEKQPLRVVLKGRGGMPEGWPMNSDGGGEVVVFEPEELVRPDFSSPSRSVSAPSGNLVQLELVLEALYKRKVYSVLVEGGSRVFNSFLNTDLWDRLTVFQSPDMLGGGLHFYNHNRMGGRQGRKIDDKLCLHNRKSQWSGRDVEVRGDREEYPCLQD